jgi:ribosomal protein S18 acetylase RimI-like enzyme
MITIEPARPEHRQSILRIAARSDNFLKEDVDCIAQLWETAQLRGADAGLTFLVACEGGETQGFICFGPHVGVNGPYDVFWVAVDPDARHHHTGQHLLDACEMAVRTQGGSLVYIETGGSSAYAATRRFYIACGYTAEAQVHDFYAPGDDLVIFIKRL